MRSTNDEEVYKLVLAGELAIDEQGRVWRTAFRRFGVLHTYKKQRRAERPSGHYLSVRGTVSGRKVGTGAHRLVYRHFFGPIPHGLTVNHRDGKKRRNLPSNLELATYSEQALHAIHILKVGVAHRRGEKNPHAKLTELKVAQIRDARKKGARLRTLAAKYKTTPQTISAICLGVRWSH